MENILFNELMVRDFDVDVGMLEYSHRDSAGKCIRSQLEIDFVANKGSKRYYIQSALTVADEEKRKQEINSLTRIGDSFKKIVVVRDNVMPWHDEQGILYMGIEDFYWMKQPWTCNELCWIISMYIFPGSGSIHAASWHY